MTVRIVLRWILGFYLKCAPKAGNYLQKAGTWGEGWWLWFVYQSFTGELSRVVFRTDRVSMTMDRSLNSLKGKMAGWLRQGVSPRRLALTLALGFAIGCIPVIGVPTALCAGLALALRLNLPAMQAANYAVMPLQLALMVPFVRLGGWLMALVARHGVTVGAALHGSGLAAQLGGMAGQALLAWLLLAAPAVVLMTATLTPVLRRVPALAEAE